jgi:hypothetical protein
MMSLAGRLLWIALASAVSSVSGQTILWNSDANATNETSTGALMDAGFRFELGVFNSGFTPTALNIQDWSANWQGAVRTGYDAANKRYTNSYTPADNNAPFSIGKATYVWGFRGNPVAGEWILFRAGSWNFPEADPPVPPPPIEWFAKNATAVLGSIQSSGSPYLMKSAAVTNAAPPKTTWAQWQATNLTSEPLDEPHDDPDGDGIPNLLEFIFGTPPRTAGSPPLTPVTLSSGHAVISIPRRVDHTATLIVEVSGDLSNWSSGPLYTEVVSDGISALVVRDLTALDASNPKRFIRLRAVLP